MKQNLTIIVPTCDRPYQLANAIASVADNGGASCAMLIVNDGTGAPLKFQTKPGIDIVETMGREGASRARNLGASLAKTDYIMFLDDDDIIINDYVKDVLLAVERGEFLCGVCNTTQKTQRLSKKGVFQTQPKHKLKDCVFGAGMGFWINRDLFNDMGGFDVDLRLDEDTEFFARLKSRKIKIHINQKVGVKIAPAEGTDANERSRLTNSAPQLGAESYGATLIKCLALPNISLFDKLFLIRRFVRVASRAEVDVEALGCLGKQYPHSGFLKSIIKVRSFFVKKQS